MAKNNKKSSGHSGLKIKNIKYLGGFLLSKMARGGAKQLRTNAEEVNKLNVFPVPDGDTGTNMSMTMSAARTELEKLTEGRARDIVEEAARDIEAMKLEV